MVKVRGLKTSAGEYGKIKNGSIADMRASVAQRLAVKGIVEIIGEEDGVDEYPEIKGGIRIKDSTGLIQDLGDNKVFKKDPVIIKHEAPTPEETKAEPAPAEFEQGKVEPEEEMKAEPSEVGKATPEETKKAEPKETGKKK